MTTHSIKKALELRTSADKAQIYKRFFKTGKGEYGEGDIFIGVTIPEQRLIARQHLDTTTQELQELLHSPIHEHRLTALIVMCEQFKRMPEKRGAIYEFYTKNFEQVNNWDLVDVSAPHIAGAWLLDKKKSVLELWACSHHLWTRRIAIVSTQQFIRKGLLEETFKIATLLLHDEHDLIHKATGWMLREAGKKDEQALKRFLDVNADKMPRTMLRYAIERLDAQTRATYLKKYMHGTQRSTFLVF